MDRDVTTCGFRHSMRWLQLIRCAEHAMHFVESSRQRHHRYFKTA